MPEFDRDPWGAQDMYQDQLRHYGIKQGRMPDAKPAPQDPTAPSLTEGSGEKVPRRKPVPTSTSETRGRSPRPGSPVSRSQSPRSQCPAQRIYRTPSGRFNPATIKREEAPRQAPTPPASPGPSVTRTTRSRTNSNTSTSSWSNRRESLSKYARRLSDAVKNTVDIVKMDRHERLGYVRTKHDSVERDSSPTPALAPHVDSPTRTTPVSGKFLEHLDDEPSPLPQTPTQPKPGQLSILSKGEKLALSVSKAADPLKPRARKGTNDSEMSFGMTDLAPPGAMQECASCRKPTEEYLIGGLCRQCYDLRAKVARARRGDEETMFVDPWQFPQGRSTWPDVPTADQKYMKLPNRKKIIRIRETIYEDPGNPFGDDSESERLSPGSPAPNQKPLPPPPPIDEAEAGRVDPFEINPFDDGAFSKVAATPKNSVADVWADNTTLHTRKDSNIIRAHRRSKSVAVPLPNPSEEFGEYVAPRTYWRKGSIPTSRWSQPIQSSDESWRDTKFYGFYEDLIQDYDGRNNRL